MKRTRNVDDDANPAEVGPQTGGADNRQKNYDVNEATLVAKHYSQRQNQNLEQRKQSPIYNLRCLNNFVKSTLIQTVTKKKDRVMDLACGKGGDLGKFKKAEIGYYCGIDIALESVRRDAIQRYNKGDYTFPATFIAGDAFVHDLEDVLGENVKGLFDVVSCQFAIHYSFSTEKRARKAFENISKALRPGGHFVGTTVDSNVLVRNLRQTDGLLFGNDVIEVNFDEKHSKKEFLPPGFGIEYSFTLEDAVTDCKESLVPLITFAELAKEYDLEIMRWTNFHQYVHEMLNLPKEGKYRSVHELWFHLMQPPGGRMDGKSMVPRNAEGQSLLYATAVKPLNKSLNAALTEQEWEAAEYYTTFILRKKTKASTAEEATKEIQKVVNERPPIPKSKPLSAKDVLVLEGAA
jgi:mRNA (guanine-N7-)-methyltransferase|tara:strand:- start:3039 stop:4256 length:1218 start_codon:yes stop_codon:yes gene_type:complete